MSNRLAGRRHRTFAAVTLLAAVALPAGALAADPSVPAPAASIAPAGPLTPLTVGLGYIPSVQFAPFYLAQQSGAYAAAGLDVTFLHQTDTDLITLIGQGNVDIGLGDGTSIIIARSQEIPVRYAASIYSDFPSVVVSKVSTGITTAADLKGKTLGIPGRYGSGWIMLQALLASAGLTTDDLTVTLYPDYGQAVGLAQDQVQAATGFVNNEPVQLALQGTPVNVLTVDDIVPLPGPGLVVGESTLADKHQALASFVAVTLGAMEQVRVHPQVGLDATFAAVPELAAAPDTQRAILDATIAAWSNDYTDAHGLGAIDPTSWDKSVAFMTAMPDSPVAPGGVVPAEAFTTELLPVR
ncbi:MAG: ABC transporter substrate-binding protein [Chloroflexi bacterium]|nr:ABC transporter substrate-binding protein [Chloroflexota bacterium]